MDESKIVNIKSNTKTYTQDVHMSGAIGVAKRIGRRTFDILCSSVALVLLSPLLVTIALIICLDDPKGGPLFTQKRCGLNGKPFKFYKFRSMHVDAEKNLEALLEKNEMDGPVFKIRNDPRITRFGKFIRKTSLDELPQIVNVLKGDMSIVGPRPPLPKEVGYYNRYQFQRLSVKPGLTCFWQTTPRRNSLSFDEWVELDLKYINEMSALVDFKLIIRTLFVMISSQGQ